VDKKGRSTVESHTRRENLGGLTVLRKVGGGIEEGKDRTGKRTFAPPHKGENSQGTETRLGEEKNAARGARR